VASRLRVGFNLRLTEEALDCLSPMLKRAGRYIRASTFVAGAASEPVRRMVAPADISGHA